MIKIGTVVRFKQSKYHPEKDDTWIVADYNNVNRMYLVKPLALWRIKDGVRWVGSDELESIKEDSYGVHN